jgi:hypothetical protein
MPRKPTTTTTTVKGRLGSPALRTREGALATGENMAVAADVEVAMALADMMALEDTIVPLTDTTTALEALEVLEAHPLAHPITGAQDDAVLGVVAYPSLKIASIQLPSLLTSGSASPMNIRPTTKTLKRLKTLSPKPTSSIPRLRL